MSLLDGLRKLQKRVDALEAEVAELRQFRDDLMNAAVEEEDEEAGVVVSLEGERAGRARNQNESLG